VKIFVLLLVQLVAFFGAMEWTFDRKTDGFKNLVEASVNKADAAVNSANAAANKAEAAATKAGGARGEIITLGDRLDLKFKELKNDFIALGNRVDSELLKNNKKVDALTGQFGKYLGSFELLDGSAFAARACSLETKYVNLKRKTIGGIENDGLFLVTAQPIPEDDPDANTVNRFQSNRIPYSYYYMYFRNRLNAYTKTIRELEENRNQLDNSIAALENEAYAEPEDSRKRTHWSSYRRGLMRLSQEFTNLIETLNRSNR